MRSHKLDQLGRETFWRGHVDTFLRERGSQRVYCGRHGISARELRHWRTRFYAAPDLTGPAPTALPAPGFGNGLIEIELAGGRRIRVGPDVDAGALRRVLAVLENPA